MHTSQTGEVDWRDERRKEESRLRGRTVKDVALLDPELVASRQKAKTCVSENARCDAHCVCGKEKTMMGGYAWVKATDCKCPNDGVGCVVAGRRCGKCWIRGGRWDQANLETWKNHVGRNKNRAYLQASFSAV